MHQINAYLVPLNHCSCTSFYCNHFGNVRGAAIEINSRNRPILLNSCVVILFQTIQRSYRYRMVTRLQILAQIHHVESSLILIITPRPLEKLLASEHLVKIVIKQNIEDAIN